MDLITIQSIDVLQAVNRTEIEMQISTAKQYPRVIKDVLSNIKTLALMDPETSESCFYALSRDSGEGDAFIQGVSVRMVEIIASSWTNLRVQTRILSNDGRVITALGLCHDLETNVSISVEVQRSITREDGSTCSEGMQIATGNAASAIAFRNAVLKVIPKALTQKVINEIHAHALTQCADVEVSRNNVMAYFKRLGVGQERVLRYLQVKALTDVTEKEIFTLRHLKTAITEGSTTIAECFKFKPTVTERKSKIKAKGAKGVKKLILP